MPDIKPTHQAVFLEHNEGNDRYLCSRCKDLHVAEDTIVIEPGDDFYVFFLCRTCCRDMGERRSC